MIKSLRVIALYPKVTFMRVPENEVVSKTKVVQMVTLRIGKPAPGGKAPPGQKAINRRDPPSKFS